MTRIADRSFLAVVIAMALAGGCVPTPPGRTADPPAASPEAPAPVSIVDEAALAWGPPLILDGTTLESEDDVLAKLQDALADLEGAKAETRNSPPNCVSRARNARPSRPNSTTPAANSPRSAGN